MRLLYKRIILNLFVVSTFTMSNVDLYPAYAAQQQKKRFTENPSETASSEEELTEDQFMGHNIYDPSKPNSYEEYKQEKHPEEKKESLFKKRKLTKQPVKSRDSNKATLDLGTDSSEEDFGKKVEDYKLSKRPPKKQKYEPKTHSETITNSSAHSSENDSPRKSVPVKEKKHVQEQKTEIKEKKATPDKLIITDWPKNITLNAIDIPKVWSRGNRVSKKGYISYYPSGTRVEHMGTTNHLTLDKWNESTQELDFNITIYPEKASNHVRTSNMRDEHADTVLMRYHVTGRKIYVDPAKLNNFMRVVIEIDHPIPGPLYEKLAYAFIKSLHEARAFK